MQILDSERRGIPHYLIDILEPHQDFSAGQFYELARAAISDILEVRYLFRTLEYHPLPTRVLCLEPN